MVEDKYLDILMEEMNSKFELVLEGHQVLRSDMRRIEKTLSEKIDENSARIKINTDMIRSNADMIKVNTNMIRSNADMITALDIKLSKRIDEVDEKLTNRIDKVDEKLSKRIDEVDEKLTNRIDSVEESLGARLDAVAVDLKAHRADTEAHHGIYQVQEPTT